MDREPDHEKPSGWPSAITLHGCPAGISGSAIVPRQRDRAASVETTVDGDRVVIDLAGPSAPASAADLYRRIDARLHRRVMLTVRFTEQRVLDSPDGRTGP